MQSHNFKTFRRTPPPDIVRGTNVPKPPDAACRPSSAPAVPPDVPPPPSPDFLIIGLFALRLTRRLVESLEHYPGRDADMVWITSFLTPYPSDYALAKISGPRKDDYLATYQDIVSRMKRQPRYPVRFMQLSPDRSIQQRMAQSGASRDGPREMTDLERMEMVDFCDAAGEWGSVVPIPAREADRMIQLTDQRRIADADARIPPHNDGNHTG